MLTRLHNVGSPWDEMKCVGAARDGRLDMLKMLSLWFEV